MSGRAPIPILLSVVEHAIFPETTRLARLRLVHWAHCEFASHYRRRAGIAGVYKTARQLRKQGIALHTALSVLAAKGPRHV